MFFWEKRDADQGQIGGYAGREALLAGNNDEFVKKFNAFIASHCLSNQAYTINAQDLKAEFSVSERYNSLVLNVILLQEMVKKRVDFDIKRAVATIAVIVDEFMTRGGDDLILLSRSYTDSNYLSVHIVNCFLMTIGLAQRLEFSKNELNEIGLCALLHDFGMVDFMDYAQKPGKLGRDDINKIRQHPFVSVDLFKNFINTEASEIILDIHERELGQGYPRGKKGDDIAPWAKLISVCDIFEALLQDRPYRRRYDPFEAIKIIIKMKHHQLEEKVIRKLIEFVSIYPIGSLVRLNTGEIALVKRSNPGFPTKPYLNLVMRADGKMVSPGQEIDFTKNELVYIKSIVTNQEIRGIVNGLTV